MWGKFAQNKIPLIDEGKNVIIKSPHPSPFSADRGFFGSRPFSRCNDALIKFGESPIDWQLPQEVMAIGDNLNDESMIRMAGVGVAMENAAPEIKKIANFITKSNNDNGVAYAIRHFCK